MYGYKQLFYIGEPLPSTPNHIYNVMYKLNNSISVTAAFSVSDSYQCSSGNLRVWFINVNAT